MVEEDETPKEDDRGEFDGEPGTLKNVYGGSAALVRDDDTVIIIPVDSTE